MAEQITDAPAPGEHVVVGTDPESGVLTTYAFKHRDSTLFPAVRLSNCFKSSFCPVSTELTMTLKDSNQKNHVGR